MPSFLSYSSFLILYLCADVSKISSSVTRILRKFDFFLNRKKGDTFLYNLMWTFFSRVCFLPWYTNKNKQKKTIWKGWRKVQLSPIIKDNEIVILFTFMRLKMFLLVTHRTFFKKICSLVERSCYRRPSKEALKSKKFDTILPDFNLFFERICKLLKIKIFDSV